MDELKAVFDELRRHKDKSLFSVVIAVEHPASNVSGQEGLERYVTHWRQFTGDIAARLADWNVKDAREDAASTMRAFARELSDDLSLNIRRRDGEEQALSKVAERIGLAGRDAAGA